MFRLSYSLPSCFNSFQLPVEIGLDNNINSKFTAVDKYGDLFALGGKYGD